MTFTDWLIDITLILMVLRQLRESPMDRKFWLIPTVLVAVTAHTYLTALPTGGSDLVLIGAFLAVGAVLGLVGARTTRVRAVNGQAFVRAGVVAAGIWVASMSARLGFIIWITHGGADALGRFSVQHHITSGAAWQDALVLMALAEVAVRISILLVRGHRAVATTRSLTTQLVAA